MGKEGLFNQNTRSHKERLNLKTSIPPNHFAETRKNNTTFLFIYVPINLKIKLKIFIEQNYTKLKKKKKRPKTSVHQSMC